MSVQIEKVIRIEMDAEMFNEEISADYTEWWFGYEDLKENKPVYVYILKWYPQAIELLKNGDANYISVYADLF